MMARKQPRERLTAVARGDQLRTLLRGGPRTLAELAPSMGCSEALVLHYAKRIPFIHYAKQAVQTAQGERQKIVVSLATGGAE